MNDCTRDLVSALKLASGEVRFYKREGYLVLPGLVSPAVATDLHDDVLSIMRQSGNSYDHLCDAPGTAGSLVQTTQYLRGSSTDRLVNSPSLRGLAEQLMEGPGRLYMPFTAVKAGGRGGTFNFHQDNQFTRFDGPGINIWIALMPMSPENGCLQVVPRSHLNGTIDSMRDDKGQMYCGIDKVTDFLPLRMNAGDAVAFSRLTIHGSGPNHTEEPRVAYAVQFHRDDVHATWDGQTHLLKDHPRFQVAPVSHITPPVEKSKDGH